MPKHILFVCKSCNNAAHKRIKPSQGAQLLEQLNTFQSQDSSITIQPVDCLWMCSRACVIAFSAPGKATYLFTNIPTTAAADLLTFGTLYHHSKDGNIPWKQFPEALQSAQVAKIPPV